MQYSAPIEVPLDAFMTMAPVLLLALLTLAECATGRAEVIAQYAARENKVVAVNFMMLESKPMMAVSSVNLV